MENPIVWFIGLLVVCVIAITLVIPSVTTAVTGLNIAGSNTNETFNGIAGSSYQTLNYPIETIQGFRNNSNAVNFNGTTLNGNGSRNVSLQSNIDNRGYYSYNITVNCTAQSTNVSVYANNSGSIVFLGYLIGTTACPVTYTQNATLLRSPFVLIWNATNESGATARNFTNVSVQYNFWNTNTNYTVTTAASGLITPSINGTFQLSYQYGTTGTDSAISLLLLIPLLIGAVLLILILQDSGVF